jgi:hypothetical protein
LKSSNTKKWWHSIKELTGSAPRGGKELDVLANKLTDENKKALADKINIFFQSVSSDLPKPNKDVIPPRDQNEPIPAEYIITLLDVEKQLMKLDVSKAPGPDNIPTWVLKDFAGFLAGPVCAIYNASIREGHLPLIWKSATTRPIPKVCPPKAVETDLRPISLTPTISKELETHVVGWLWKLVWPKMDPYQFGAMSGSSTVHALIEMLHDWYSNTDNSKDRNFIHAVLVDYSKAFDRIDPNILLEKLKGFNIPNFLLHWVCDFLSDRTQRVKVGEVLSDVLDVWATVPQGTKLGVFLFLLMINDLKTNMPTYKYVDDTTIYNISNDPKSTKVQEAMEAIMTWSRQNNMKINAKKTKEIFISFNRAPPSVPLVKVNDIELERVECVTLLGLRISNDLTWETHIDYIVKRAQTRLYCLNMLRRAKVAAEDIVQIYCSKIRPVLEYASPVWHGGLTQEQSDSVEHIQERAMRIAFPQLEYHDALKAANIPYLYERRISHCKGLFMKMQDPQDKLHRVLPPIRSNVKSTRSNIKYSLPKAHTNRYKNSFLPYVLYNCQ